MDNMKTDTFKYEWEGKEITVFDFERCITEYINYGNIEKAKNGFVTCSKYTGKKTTQPRSKVIVFSNDEPDKTKLSADRWIVRILFEGKLLSDVPE